MKQALAMVDIVGFIQTHDYRRALQNMLGTAVLAVTAAASGLDVATAAALLVWSI